MPRTVARRDGNVAAVTAVCLIGILSVSALTLDGGLIMEKRRDAQSAADAAALAAAADLYYNWFTYFGKTDTPTGTAAAAAQAQAKANGYENGVNGVTVTVNILPKSGPFKNTDGHAEVIISASQKRFFSKIWASDDTTYGARAVARGKRGGISSGIMVLAPSGKGAYQTSGGGGVDLTGAPLIVNSNDAAAMVANGNGSSTAPQYYVAGVPGWSTPGGGSFVGTMYSGSQPMPDPLADLPVPDTTGLTVFKNGFKQSGGNKSSTIDPGVYTGGISIQGGTVTMNPGTYYMDGGGFNVGGTGSVSGSGVMIYNKPSSNNDKIDISGQGSINLTPPTSGTYQGVLFFEDRTSTVPVNINGSNATSMTMTGTFYAASATLNVSGNGTQQTIGAQYISYNVAISGNAAFSVSWSPDITPGVREVWLVE
jgi:Flp pilus assembly protein TadG